MNYYEQQLNNINKPYAPVKVKFSGENMVNGSTETNYMDLNEESIQAIRDYLDVIESELG